MPTPPPSKPVESAVSPAKDATPNPPAATASNQTAITPDDNSGSNNTTSDPLPTLTLSQNTETVSQSRPKIVPTNLDKPVSGASSSAAVPSRITPTGAEKHGSSSQSTNTPATSTEAARDTLSVPTPPVSNASVPSPAATATGPSSVPADTALPSLSPNPTPASSDANANPVPSPANGPATADPPAEAPKKKRQYQKRKQPAEAQAATTGEDGAAPPKPKRQRKKKAATADAGQDGQPAAEGEATPAEPAAPKRVRRRQITPNPEDIPADGRPDHTTTKIGDLTRDLGIGKKFKHADLIVERQRQARHDAKMRKLEKQKIAMGLVPNNSQKDDSQAGTPAADDGAAAKPSSGPGIDFDIIDGQIMINQNSLVINQHAAEGNVQLETVEEDEFTHLTTSASYLRPSRAMGSNQWDDVDTEKFYKYLKMFGTDFETISHMFPGRNRRQIKLKFTREEKHRPNRINAAIMARGEKRVAIDIDEYKATRPHDDNWITPDKFRAEQETIRKEQEKELEARRQERRDLGLLDDEPAKKKSSSGADQGSIQPEEETEEMLIDDADVGGASVTA